MTMQQGGGERFPYRERKLLLRNIGKGEGFEVEPDCGGSDRESARGYRPALPVRTET